MQTGARALQLAMLERLVTDARGSHVFCDTDSMAIVASASTAARSHALAVSTTPAAASRRSRLSWDQVETIRARFVALNPYDRKIVPASTLELEARTSPT